MNTLMVYTDGSYFSELKAEGLSFRILGLANSPVNFAAGRVVHKKRSGSSAIAEVHAVILALKKIKRLGVECDQIVINVDFDSVVNVINDFSMYPYENSLYYKKGGCWKELIDLLAACKDYRVVGNWVKGHKARNIDNNIVDLMARNAAMNAYEDKHKYFQIYAIDERTVSDVVTELEKSVQRAYELKSKQHQENILHEKNLAMKRALRAMERRQNKNKNRYVLKEGHKEIVVSEFNSLRDAIDFKETVLQSLSENISLKMNKDMAKRFEFFSKSIDNYAENMSFIYDEDKDIYVHIANALKCIRNRHQNLNLCII